MVLRSDVCKLAIGLILTSSGVVWAQESKGDGGADAAGEPLGIKVGAGYSLWIGDLDFECRTSTEVTEYDVKAMNGAQVFGLMEVSEGWSARLAGDFLFGSDMNAIIGSLGVVYTPAGLLREIMDEFRDAPVDMSFRASVLFGRLDYGDVEGDFDPGLGFEAGLSFRWGLDEILDGLGISLDIAGRYIRFEFDADDTVVEADDEVGGFGLSVVAGISYSF